MSELFVCSLQEEVRLSFFLSFYFPPPFLIHSYIHSFTIEIIPYCCHMRGNIIEQEEAIRFLLQVSTFLITFSLSNNISLTFPSPLFSTQGFGDCVRVGDENALQTTSSLIEFAPGITTTIATITTTSITTTNPSFTNSLSQQWLSFPF